MLGKYKLFIHISMMTPLGLRASECPNALRSFPSGTRLSAKLDAEFHWDNLNPKRQRYTEDRINGTVVLYILLGHKRSFCVLFLVQAVM
jgi:hypothetical protein